eukprot:TRINITY_DN13321_c0_g1_i1.p1 TRINITY_DN13321_c0_g1~~TRINITY_DN13321_c0_g1_i1.p1  ORF type:complete len:250 (+),score=24.27 TRINITY_DN13321_c0_g1_i1:50-799(+)
MFMTAIRMVYYMSMCLNLFFVLRMTVTTALLGVKAVESPFQEQKTAVLSRITEALHIVLFVGLTTGIIGVRVSSTPEIQLVFARLFFAGSAAQSILISAFGYLHLSIIINALKEHSKTAKSHGLDGKHFKDVIERLSKERLATVILVPYIIFVLAVIGIPRIMTYTLPVVNIWVALLGLAGSSTPPLDPPPGSSALSDAMTNRLEGNMSKSKSKSLETMDSTSFQFEAQEEEYLSRSLELSASSPSSEV